MPRRTRKKLKATNTEPVREAEHGMAGKLKYNGPLNCVTARFDFGGDGPAFCAPLCAAVMPAPHESCHYHIWLRRTQVPAEEVATVATGALAELDRGIHNAERRLRRRELQALSSFDTGACLSSFPW